MDIKLVQDVYQGIALLAATGIVAAAALYFQRQSPLESNVLNAATRFGPRESISDRVQMMCSNKPYISCGCSTYCYSTTGQGSTMDEIQ